MKLTQLFLDEIDREAPRTRRALENNSTWSKAPDVPGI